MPNVGIGILRLTRSRPRIVRLMFTFFPGNSLTSRHNRIKMINTVNQGAVMQYEISKREPAANISATGAAGSRSDRSRRPQAGSSVAVGAPAIARSGDQSQHGRSSLYRARARGVARQSPGPGVFVAEPKTSHRKMRGGGGCWRFSTGSSPKRCTWRSRRRSLARVSTRARQFQWKRGEGGLEMSRKASMTHAILTERLTKYYGGPMRGELPGFARPGRHR